MDQPPDAPAAHQPEGPVVVPPPSDKALRYHRSGNVIWAVEQLLGLVLPALLLFTRLSAWLRTVAAGVAHGTFYPTLVIYLALLSALLFVIQLPLGYYVGYAREHAYGLSSQRFGKWAGDEVKGLVVGVLLGAAVLWVPYLLLRASPQRWWLWTGALALPFFGLVLLVTPVFIAPLFNKFGPMKDKALESEVLAVAARAGVEGARVFEVEKSVDTKKVNAYVTGVGQTKRIVLWDTLLGRLTPRQTRFVVGHELGHYVLGHVWINILISSALAVAGLYGVHRTADGLIAAFGDRFGFDHISDVASMPLLMLLLALFSMALTPAMLALSRHHERAADKFGLELLGDNHAAATAFVALQEQNLAVPRPGRLYKLFRASHPPIGERVDFINGYRPTGSPDAPPTA
jgi:STE24 endopeptidase